MTAPLGSFATVGQALKAITEYFEQHDLYYGHGTDNAWDEAVALLCAVMNFPVDVSDEVLPQTVLAEDQVKMKALATARVQQRTPLAYLLQQAWFMGMPFYVDERVLIPRSPFGELISQCFSPWVKPDLVQRILEVGTGSGCMAIAAATQFPQAQVVAADIDEAALTVARQNVMHYELAERVTLVQSDVLQSIDGQFDIIMSNPPYVGEAEMQTLPDEYRHEPYSALWAADNGLAIVNQLIEQAARYLNPKGILVVEVGNSQPLVQAQYPQAPFIWLEFAAGGHGVFLLTQKACLNLLKEE